MLMINGIPKYFLYQNSIKGLIRPNRWGGIVQRITVETIAKKTGLCKPTIRKLADEGRIPCNRDMNGWRIFY